MVADGVIRPDEWHKKHEQEMMKKFSRMGYKIPKDPWKRNFDKEFEIDAE